MAFSKIIFTDENGTSTTFMDATPATAAAADITAPKTAMLANGIVTTGTGSGGGGGGGDTPAFAGVVFIDDYDGSVVTTWDVSEVAGKSALPSNPSHTGLTSQGWNWTLVDIKSHLTTFPTGTVVVGQNYEPTSGKTEIDCYFPADCLHPYLGFGIQGTAVIDWDDNGATTTVTGTSVSTKKWGDHVYSTAGARTITISVTTGTIRFFLGGSTYAGVFNMRNADSSNRQYSQCITALRLATGVTFGNYAFNYLINMESVTIPKTIAPSSYIFNGCYSLKTATFGTSTNSGSYWFSYCYSLKYASLPSNITTLPASVFAYCYSMLAVTIPNTVTTIGGSAFNYCRNLAPPPLPSGLTSIGSSAFAFCYNIKEFTAPNNNVTLASAILQNDYSLRSVTLPTTMTEIYSSLFSGCYSLKNVTIPSNVTTISSGAFYTCYNLESITIPSGVTTIDSSAFGSCTSLKTISLPSRVTALASSVFSACYNLESIDMPANATIIDGSAFSSCYKLGSITIPSGVTSIGNSAFANCYALRQLTIPSLVTTLGTNALQNLYSCAKLRFEPTTPPTAAAANTFSNLPTTCVISVPVGSLSSYTSAQYYPSSSTYTYIEE